MFAFGRAPPSAAAGFPGGSLPEAMSLPLFPLLLFLAAAPPDSTAAASDTTATRVVRHFAPVEVRAPALDLHSSTVAHAVPEWTLRSPLVSSVADVLAAQPGVVAQAGELHVRGGRAGETLVSLDGVPLREPIRGESLALPMLAIGGAELVSGAPPARFGGALAGQLDLHAVSATARPSFAWRWRTDGRLDTHYDQVAARATTPLPIGGLGLVAAGDATLDDTSLPALRTQGRRDVLGLSLGWRAENRLLGYVKLAPVRDPARFSLQVLGDRGVHMPYDPQWTLAGWVYVPPNPKAAPEMRDFPDTNTTPYRAADHAGITDNRRLAAVASFATPPGPLRGKLALGWLRDRSVTSVSGRAEPEGTVHHVFYNFTTLPDRFHVVWGDYPTYRESASDVWSLTGEAERTGRTTAVSAGAGLTYEEVRLREQDWQPLGRPTGSIDTSAPLDTLRRFHAWAPGAFAFTQLRWEFQGMKMNSGLRAEYWTPGSAGRGNTLPWDGKGSLTWSPRLGVVFPVSVREAISFAYVRLHQAPDRDLLYDDRTAVSNRRPLGNPDLKPATVISYEAALKHLFDAGWSMQASIFYRDLFGQPGVRDFSIPQGPLDLRYENADEGHAEGVEWAIAHAGERASVSASLTWMQAWGTESRSSGDPYGALRDARTAPIDDRPLHWDRELTLLTTGAWNAPRGVRVDWSNTVGSPLPWTPKPRRQPFTDPGAVNSRRLDWMETTNVAVSWNVPRARGLRVGLEAENLFDGHSALAATLDGYPNPTVNTLYDDYSAYRDETGDPGGAYWADGFLGGPPHWVPVHDPRLFQTPRTIRAVVGTRW